MSYNHKNINTCNVNAINIPTVMRPQRVKEKQTNRNRQSVFATLWWGFKSVGGGLSTHLFESWGARLIRSVVSCLSIKTLVPYLLLAGRSHVHLILGLGSKTEDKCATGDVPYLLTRTHALDRRRLQGLFSGKEENVHSGCEKLPTAERMGL